MRTRALGTGWPKPSKGDAWLLDLSLHGVVRIKPFSSAKEKNQRGNEACPHVIHYLSRSPVG
jgi:hypothetical protein